MHRPVPRAVARLLSVLLLLTCAPPAGAREAVEKRTADSEPLQIAVAANFAGCLQELSLLWQEQGETEPTLIVGSTGRHFAQIRAGAPFDLFVAADVERPRRLCESGEAVAASRFTYALGRLALWAPGLDAPSGAPWTDLLDDPDLRHLALADPRVAPYGQAARQALQHAGRWDPLEDRRVIGRSVGQAWQFVASGAAEAGLLAYSQTLVDTDPDDVWLVPDDLYDPIEQQAVLLDRARDNAAAKRFLAFLRSTAAAGVIASYGYGFPGEGAP